MTDPVFCLSIAGFDPSGGAGLSADLRVFRHFGIAGLAAATAITPQNTRGVRSVHPVSGMVLREQLKLLVQDFPIAAVKTGQIPSLETAKELHRFLKNYKGVLVVDPILRPSRGNALVAEDAALFVKTRILPMATLVTPNRHETEALCGFPIRDKLEMENAAQVLVPRFGRAILLKGGHGSGLKSDDLLFDGENFHWFSAKRLNIGEVHGTGCHLSAAICAELAKGNSLPFAVRKAKRYLFRLLSERTYASELGMKLIVS